MYRRRRPSLWALVLAALWVAALGACDNDSPSVVERLQQVDADKPKGEVEQVPVPDELPPELSDPYRLPGPTEAELKAWDRKNPEGEKHLYKWDKANLAKMEKYWKQLRCFRDRIKLEGEKARGTDPTGPEQEHWAQFKGGFIHFVNGWQQRLFAAEPRIHSKSKLIGHILQAHELVMTVYPKAYNNNDELALKKADALWLIVEDKVTHYVEQLGGKWKFPDLDNPKEREQWDRFCKDALTPPKEGPKKEVKKKTPI